MILIAFIGCNTRDTATLDFDIYKWRAISFSDELEGELDTVIIADTLINGIPINIDSTNHRFEFYFPPSNLSHIIETDTLKLINRPTLIGYHHWFFESWYSEDIGLLLSINPHAGLFHVWSYELSEIVEFQNGTKSVTHVDSLVGIIQAHRINKLLEMEKLYGE